MKIVSDFKLNEWGRIMITCRKWALFYEKNKKVPKVDVGYHLGKSYNAFTCLQDVHLADMIWTNVKLKDLKKYWAGNVILFWKNPIELNGREFHITISKKFFERIMNHILLTVESNPKQLVKEIRKMCKFL